MSNYKNNHFYSFFSQSVPVKGAFVKLDKPFLQAVKNHSYQNFLGELIVANVLMSGNLKFKGKLITQLQGGEHLKFMVSETTNKASDTLTMRASIRLHNTDMNTWQELTKGNTVFVSTLVFDNDKTNPYQGLVKVNSDGLGETVSDYLQNSEQLPSHVVLFANEKFAYGLLLEQVAGNDDFDFDNFLNFVKSSKYYKALCSGSSDDELYVNLLNELSVFDLTEGNVKQVDFACNCSQARMQEMWKNYFGDEKPETTPQITCEYCKTVFDIVC